MRGAQERYSCVHCGKHFAMKSDLNRHIKMCAQVIAALPGAMNVLVLRHTVSPH